MIAADVLSPIIGALGRPLQVVDVGARWGVGEQWKGLGDEAARFICFEPDPQECARLNEARAQNVTYLPYAVGAHDAELALHITLEPSGSSAYPPLERLYNDYPYLAMIRPMRTIRVPCRTLDAALAEVGVDGADVIKLDTQGSELDVLRGADRTLATCGFIDAEVMFNPLYEGQALFPAVDARLREMGFVLWRMTELVHYTPAPAPGPRPRLRVAAAPGSDRRVVSDQGQLFWGQAHYVHASLPRTGIEPPARERALAGAITAGLYGHWDLTLEILAKLGEDALAARTRSALVRSGDASGVQDETTLLPHPA